MYIPKFYVVMRYGGLFSTCQFVNISVCMPREIWNARNWFVCRSHWLDTANVLNVFFLFFFYCLAEPGGMWDLVSSLTGWNPCPLHWDRESFTTGPLRKFTCSSVSVSSLLSKGVIQVHCCESLQMCFLLAVMVMVWFQLQWNLLAISTEFWLLLPYMKKGKKWQFAFFLFIGLLYALSD